MNRDDWLEDPLMSIKEGLFSYVQPKGLPEDATQKWQSFHSATRLKLEGADHFARLALGAASMPDDMGLPSLAFRQTSWYLDAFFFELMAAYDTLLQELNILYGRDLRMDRVKWKKLKGALPSAVVELMEQEWDSDWFRRLRWYRNRTTHQLRLPRSSMKVPFGDKSWHWKLHKVQLLYFDETDAQQPRVEDIKEACPHYLSKMLDHIHAVWTKMAEDGISHPQLKYSVCTIR